MAPQRVVEMDQAGADVLESSLGSEAVDSLVADRVRERINTKILGSENGA